ILDRHGFIWNLNFLFLGWLGVLAWFAKLFVDSTQNTVHKTSTGLSTKCFGQLDRFIDGHLGWNFITIREEKFVEAESEDIAIHRRNFIQWPIRCSLGDDVV